MMISVIARWKQPWWAAAAAVVPAGLMVYGVSVPGGYYRSLAAALWCWAAVGLAWIVTGVAWLDPSRLRPRWRLWPLALVPVLLVTSWSVASTALVGKATFAHYRADLERLGERAPVHTGVDVGPYSFNSVSRAQNCVLYDLRGPGMAKASGFAWCPGTVPAWTPADEGIYEKIDGDWYVFLVRHGSYADRATGADPWGFQITELAPIPDV